MDPELVQPDPEQPNVWWVKKYRVQWADDWAVCSCTHGLNNPGSAHCSHLFAALLAAEVVPSSDELPGRPWTTPDLLIFPTPTYDPTELLEP